MSAVQQFMSGASVMACLVIALFFLRFWRRTRDRLFAIFSLAFTVFAGNRLALTFVGEESEARPWLYLVRLAAFVLILVAIVDKNASTRR